MTKQLFKATLLSNETNPETGERYSWAEVVRNRLIAGEIVDKIEIAEQVFGTPRPSYYQILQAQGLIHTQRRRVEHETGQIMAVVAVGKYRLLNGTDNPKSEDRDLAQVDGARRAHSALTKLRSFHRAYGIIVEKYPDKLPELEKHALELLQAVNTARLQQIQSKERDKTEKKKLK